MRPANNDPVKQCLITYHITMDTLETQKQFGLWWACHSISRLKSLIQRDSDPKCRNNIVVFTNNNTKHWCKCLDTLSKQIKQYPPKSGTISEPSTSSFTSSQRNPKASWKFPTNILLRGHGHFCSAHPRPPSPPGAARPRNRGLRRLPCAAVFRLRSRSPRPSHGQNPTEWRGENLWEIFGHLKSRSFGNFGHSKILPELQEHCGFDMSWWHRVGWRPLLPLDVDSQDDVENKPGAKSDPKLFISSYYYKANWSLGNDTVVIIKNNRKSWCKCFGTLAHFPGSQNKTNETLEPSTSFSTSQRSHPSTGFPRQILLRGNGCLRPLHPRPPSPRQTAGPRNRGLRQLRSAVVFCLRSRGPRPSHRRSEKTWAPQKSKFWKLWPLDVLRPSSWLKMFLPVLFYLCNQNVPG